MKKVISLLMMSAFVFLAVACGTTPVNTDTTTIATTIATTEATTSTDATTASEATTENPIIVTPSEFDADNIIFSFGAISDVHIANANDSDDASVKFRNALNQLKAKAAESDSDGIDAIFTAGDLIDTRQTIQIQQYKKVYTSVFNVNEVPNIYCLGHYHDDNWTSAAVNPDRNNFTTIFGDDFYKNDLEPERIPTGCRHCAITADDGSVYHVITLEPISMEPTLYSSEAKEWLDKTLNEITTENPDHYVFILNHAMIYNTVYGSDLGPYWYTQDLTSILSKYPQVVTFSGHLHFPLNDERSIMQTSFTSLGTGAVRYMAIENGGYENMASATTMTDRYEFSEGLLCQLDKDGNMRIIRMDFYNSTTIGEDWVLTHPTEDKSHLEKYQRTSRADANTAPEISVFRLDQTEVKSGLQTTVVFKGIDDQFVHHYILSYYRDGVLRKQFKILSDFYRHGQWSDMKAELSQLIGTLAYGKTYKFTLQAVDSWGAMSDLKEIECIPEKPEDTTGTGDPGVIIPSDLPEAYIDFDFDEEGVYDSKNHAIVVSNTAAVITKKLTHGDASVSKPVLFFKNTYTTCQFADINTPEEMKAWAEKGFTVEAFFATNSTSAVQGVVCGTDAGGWGLAINASSCPYFITGSGAAANTYNPSTIATTKVSATNLMHVVAVYDYATKTESIYVDGELEAKTTLNEDFFPGANSAFNMFCLGADIKGSAGAEFMAFGLSMIDAKIYDTVLTPAQISSEYKAMSDWLTK